MERGPLCAFFHLGSVNQELLLQNEFLVAEKTAF